MQFLIIARDGKDADALDRRMKARDAHLEGVKKMHAVGEMIEAALCLMTKGRWLVPAAWLNFHPARNWMPGLAPILM